MAQNDIRRLSVGNGRVIELKEDSGALYARETSEWGFEEVFDLTTLPGYDAGRRATYRINGGNIERREAQEAAWEVVMAVADLALTPVTAGGGGAALGAYYYASFFFRAWEDNVDDAVTAFAVNTNLPDGIALTQSGASLFVDCGGTWQTQVPGVCLLSRGPVDGSGSVIDAYAESVNLLTSGSNIANIYLIDTTDGTAATKTPDVIFNVLLLFTTDPGTFTPAE